MKKLVALVVTIAVTVAVAGCASNIDGTAKAGEIRLPVTPDGAKVSASELDGLLLSTQQIGDIVDADMKVDKTYDEVDPADGVTPSSEECTSVVYNTMAVGYVDSGYTAARGAILHDSSDQHRVDQGVVAFKGSQEADAYAVSAFKRFQKCAHSSVTMEYSTGSKETWDIGDVVTTGLGIAVSVSSEGTEGWKCWHSLAAKSNVVVDVAACGDDMADDQATKIVELIQGNFPT